MTTWREQFEKSLLDHMTAHDLHATRSLDDYIDSYILTRPKEESLALRMMALQAFRRAYYDFEQASQECESPIERAMLLALTLMGRDLLSFGHVYLMVGGGAVESDDYEQLVIEPQARFAGGYRVDFLLTYSTVEHHDPTAQPNAERRFEERLIVECDGHDFHDRTKVQASRDRARDRDLQSRGIRVFRYTGADIWKDVMGCAEEAIKAVRVAP